MRIFGRSKITKPSAFRRTGATALAEAAGMAPVISAAAESYVPVDLEATDEMPIVREISPSSSESAAPVTVSTPDVVESQTGADAGDENSDVFVCRASLRSSQDLGPDLGIEELAAAQAEARRVTLFVYGWENVEPGPLSWSFPSLRAALEAVKTMRNAIEWCIVAGGEWADIGAARKSGAVLIEQNA